jgi:hypothetical protein
MRIQIKTRGRWRDLPSSQWDFAVWTVATTLLLSAANARAKLAKGKPIFVDDFGGAHLRGRRT